MTFADRGCAADGLRQSHAASSSASFAITPETKLALGTLKLEGTPLAVDKATAAKLLPLWQLLLQLNTSSAAAPQEVTAVIDEIQATMTPAQSQAIDEHADHPGGLRHGLPAGSQRGPRPAGTGRHASGWHRKQQPQRWRRRRWSGLRLRRRSRRGRLPGRWISRWRLCRRRVRASSTGQRNALRLHGREFHRQRAERHKSEAPPSWLERWSGFWKARSVASTGCRRVIAHEHNDEGTLIGPAPPSSFLDRPYASLGRHDGQRMQRARTNWSRR